MCLKGSKRGEQQPPLEVSMAAQAQPTSRHLSTKHSEETVWGRYTYMYVT